MNLISYKTTKLKKKRIKALITFNDKKYVNIE